MRKEEIDISNITRQEAIRLVNELEAQRAELEAQTKELKIASEELAAARNRYADLYDFAPVGYLTLSKYNIIKEANITVCQMLGTKRADLLKRRLTKFITPESRNAYFLHRRKVLNTGSRQSCELAIHCPDGGCFFTEIESIPYRDGLRITLVDWTRRKKAEEAMAEARERLQWELSSMEHLHRVGTRFIGDEPIEVVLQEVLDAAITITGADMGTLRVKDDSGLLKLAAQHKFDQPFLDFLDNVQPGQGSCGTAVMLSQNILVEDISTSPVFADPQLREALLATGVKAVQSTPIFSRSGATLGVLSTHYHTLPDLHDRHMKFIDLLTRLTGDILERKKSEPLVPVIGEFID